MEPQKTALQGFGSSESEARSFLFRLLLENRYANIEDNFKGLKKGHDSLQSSYADAVKEAEGMKLLAKQGLAGKKALFYHYMRHVGLHLLA